MLLGPMFVALSAAMYELLFVEDPAFADPEVMPLAMVTIFWMLCFWLLFSRHQVYFNLRRKTLHIWSGLLFVKYRQSFFYLEEFSSVIIDKTSSSAKNFSVTLKSSQDYLENVKIDTYGRYKKALRLGRLITKYTELELEDKFAQDYVPLFKRIKKQFEPEILIRRSLTPVSYLALTAGVAGLILFLNIILKRHLIVDAAGSMSAWDITLEFIFWFQSIFFLYATLRLVLTPVKYWNKQLWIKSKRKNLKGFIILVVYLLVAFPWVAAIIFVIFNFLIFIITGPLLLLMVIITNLHNMSPFFMGFFGVLIALTGLSGISAALFVLKNAARSWKFARSVKSVLEGRERRDEKTAVIRGKVSSGDLINGVSVFSAISDWRLSKQSIREFKISSGGTDYSVRIPESLNLLYEPGIIIRKIHISRGWHKFIELHNGDDCIVAGELVKDKNGNPVLAPSGRNPDSPFNKALQTKLKSKFFRFYFEKLYYLNSQFLISDVDSDKALRVFKRRIIIRFFVGLLMLLAASPVTVAGLAAVAQKGNLLSLLIM